MKKILERKKKKSQAGSTFTLIAASFIILFIILVFIYISVLLSKTSLGKNFIQEVLNYEAQESQIISISALLNSEVEVSFQTETHKTDVLFLIDIQYSGLNTETSNILNPVFGSCYSLSYFDGLAIPLTDRNSLIKLDIERECLFGGIQ